jgi:hypothetical protein
MTRPREVVAEILDELAADHPDARRSRRDLQRLHRAMGTRSIFVREWGALLRSQAGADPLRVLEIGAGDGTLMLGVAQALGAGRRPIELTLLDRQDLVADETRDRYARLGWAVKTRIADITDWVASHAGGAAQGAREPRWNLIVAHLFLHHFEDEVLALLLGAAGDRTDGFVAIEPRRSLVALGASHLVGALGVNFVTRTDAVRSVRAGFRGAELTALWPGRGGDWTLRERPAGFFSHCFCAFRIGAH